MSELIDKLDESKVQRILEESFPKPSEKIDGEFYPSPSKPPEIETENIFDPELLNRPDPAFLEEMGGFLDNPMAPLIKVLAQSLEACAPKPLVLPDPPKTEHKVKIFWLHRSLKIEEVEEIETVIEAFLNDGYRGFPTVCNDFLIMDFSRRKEIEENEREQ